MYRIEIKANAKTNDSTKNIFMLIGQLYRDHALNLLKVRSNREKYIYFKSDHTMIFLPLLVAKFC